jgi:glycosyltransferase involved in cell wall biosynthesis
MVATRRTLAGRGRLLYLSGGPRASTLPDADTGGARAHITGVVAGFEAQDWEVKTFVVGDHIPRVRRVPSTVVAGDAGRRFALDIARLATGRIARGWVSLRFRGFPDLVYERFAAFQALGWAFGRRGIPWILETQSVDYQERLTERESIFLSNVAERFEIRAYQQCDVIVCVSNILRDRLAQRPEIDAEKILVVPMAFDPTRFDPRRFATRHPSSGRLSIVFVGELLRRHRIDLLLHAISDIRRTDNIEVELKVAGEGPARKEWESLCMALNLDDRVRFVGRIDMDAVPEFISEADIGYVGHADSDRSPAHSSPTKLYEYMAMQKPVIAAGSDDVEKLVVEGRTGFLFKPGDRNGLASVLRRACDQRPALPTMGLAARSKVATAHTWSTRVRSMVQGIDRILSARPTRRAPGRSDPN